MDAHAAGPWGTDHVPPRPRPPLDRRRILEAALRLIDEHGLGELSMRRLGAELGVQAMSLYRYVPSKQAVIEGVRQLIFDELARLRPARAATGHWEEDLFVMARAFRDACRRHPHALSLFATDVDRAYAAAARFYEPALAALVAAGFAPDDAVDAVRTVTRYVLATELLVAAVTTMRAPLEEDEIGAVEADHPLVGHHVRSLADRPPDILEETGLQVLVAGLRDRLATAAAAPGGA